MIGRKYTFLVTIVIMGLSTFLVGVLPNYATIGVAAPVILIVLRLLQGLALGGEYGGAATYVAEHAPHGKRGLYTSFIQTTATLGLFLSLLVILGCRTVPGHRSIRGLGLAHPVPAVDRAAGRVGVDPPAAQRVAAVPADEGRRQDRRRRRSPRASSPSNGKIVLLALLGATAGQAVVWYARPVLRAVLPDPDAEGRCHHRQPADRRRAAASARRSSSCSAGCRTRSAARRSSWPAA